MVEDTKFCRDCRWLSDDAKREHWRKWRCLAAPNEAINPVTGTNDPPHFLCWQVNRTADCWMHEKGPNCLSPRKMEEITQ